MPAARNESSSPWTKPSEKRLNFVEETASHGLIANRSLSDVGLLSGFKFQLQFTFPTEFIKPKLAPLYFFGCRFQDKDHRFLSASTARPSIHPLYLHHPQIPFHALNTSRRRQDDATRTVADRSDIRPRSNHYNGPKRSDTPDNDRSYM